MRAKIINDEMKYLQQQNAIALLAREDVPDEVVSAYGGDRPNMERIISYHLRLILG